LRAEIAGDMAGAERALTRAAAVDHTFKPAWTLANFYFRINKPEKFWPMIERCLSLVEKRTADLWSFDPGPVFDLAWNEATDEKKLRQMVPRRDATLVPYVAWLYRRKLTDAALEVWPEALSLADASNPVD